MEYIKLQIGCLLIVLYVSFIYIMEIRAYKVKKREKIFEWLLIVGTLGIVFDGITAYTVNHLDKIPDIANRILHMCFLCSLDAIVFLMFIYIISITRGLPKSGLKLSLLILPFVLNILTVIAFIPKLDYVHGEITNYSMGVSAYTCFIMVAVYLVATLVILCMGWRNHGRHKMITISTYMAATIGVAVYQMITPQSLVSSLAPTFVIIGIYLNMENPVLTKLQAHNHEMVMAFSTLVENRDGSTGGHIKRTTEYVKLLAEELRDRGYYSEYLTKDYIKNLIMAAPMHDIGKIAIPDAVLQKPGKLTEQEYEVMKTHSELGGNIIKETFGNMGDDEYEKIAYDVARYHHEKWNGKGYPEGLTQKEIPLCARIMAVADVFDAVSAKRCYRDALPLDTCFEIIKNGSGQDFEPIIVEIFLDMEDRIREVYDVTCKNNESQ